jgi:hypothetical protein
MDFYKIYEALIKYFKDCNHKGLDWSSIMYSDKFFILSRSNNKYINRFKKSFYSRLVYYLGHRVLFLFEPIERITFVKGICLYLMAKINMNEFNEEDEYLLLELNKKRIKNTCLFAHDVNYYIRDKQVTTNIPNLVTTYFVAELYFQLYLKNEQKEYKNYFKDIVNDLIKTIPYFEKSQTELCFQYTTVSSYNVHNANLLFAELIVKYNFLEKGHVNKKIYDSLIQKSLNYSLTDFKKTSTYYYAGEETRNTNIDNYHTGYLLRSLHEINIYGDQYLKTYDLNKEIKKILDFYLETFIFKGKYIYKYKLKTIETHSLAESILIFSTFSHIFNNQTKKYFLDKIYKTISILYVDGKFMNKINTFKGFPIMKDELDYVRWSQSWMFFSISKLIKTTSHGS